MPTRRTFKRPLGEKPYRRLFLIAVEGYKTEVEYFGKLFPQSIIRVICLKHKTHTSPLQVLARLKQALKIEQLRNEDEAWIVIDKDNWPEEELLKLYEWSQKADNHGFALSNPKFEYWLLLHFEEGNNVHSVTECDKRLRKWIPKYDKSIDPKLFISKNIEQAIQRAEKRDSPPCVDWPRYPGSTTVYRLVKRIYI